jgi:hypothetical protein
LQYVVQPKYRTIVVARRPNGRSQSSPALYERPTAGCPQARMATVSFAAPIPVKRGQEPVIIGTKYFTSVLAPNRSVSHSRANLLFTTTTYVGYLLISSSCLMPPFSAWVSRIRMLQLPERCWPSTPLAKPAVCSIPLYVQLARCWLDSATVPTVGMPCLCHPRGTESSAYPAHAFVFGPPTHWPPWEQPLLVGFSPARA